MTPTGEQAVCSEHPSERARATCGRCGRFGCSACLTVADEPWCHRCELERWGEWNRGPFSDALVLQQGLQLFGRNAHVALALALLAGAADALLGAAELKEQSLLSAAVHLVMNGFSTAAFLLWLEGWAQGRSPAAVDVIGNAVGVLPRLLFATLAYALLVLLGLVALVVPGLMLLGQLALCQVVAVVDPGRGPIATSFELLPGRRLLVPALVQVLAYGGYVVIAVATSVISAYAVRGAAGWAVSSAGTVARGLLASLADAVLFCLWLRLRHPTQHGVA